VCKLRPKAYDVYNIVLLVKDALLGKPIDEKTMGPLRIPNLENWVQSVKDPFPVFGMLNAFVSPQVFGPTHEAGLRFDPLDLVDPNRPSEEGAWSVSASFHR